MAKNTEKFEMDFFERLLAKKPDFYQALVALGELYTARGMFEKGLAVDLKLRSLRPLDEYVHYNLACDYSLLKDRDRSFQSLEKAIVLGYTEFHHMENDRDLDFIRDDTRFGALMAKYRGKRRRPAKTGVKRSGYEDR